MRIVQINSTCGSGSTGKICLSIAKLLDENDIENYVLYSNGKSEYKNAIKYGNYFYQKAQAFFSRVFGNNGLTAKLTTKKLIKQLKRIKPDIVHIHNIHSNDVNIKLLFQHLLTTKVRVIYTFHDCWAFTGYCAHFSFVQCEGYKIKCNKCPLRRYYSWFFDHSSKLQAIKTKLIKQCNAVIITPSLWLKNKTNESLLNGLPVRVINNGIDLNTFSFKESNFREINGIKPDEFVVLGISFGWSYKKGLDVFIKLAHELPSNYKIVLVGTNKKIDKKLPKSIISIHKTDNQLELAKIYSAANLFVNPTREENFPTVNIESLACGTPVVTFNTGGSGEMLDDSCGRVIEFNNYSEMKKAITIICENNLIDRCCCTKKASEYNSQSKFVEYLNLYKELK